MDAETAVEDLVDRYHRSWQRGDLAALRECLADEIDFDWGTAVYTDPDDFVAATASGIEWRDVTLLDAIYREETAAIVYEGVNVTDGLRLRTAEFLHCVEGKITASTVVYSVVAQTA